MLKITSEQTGDSARLTLEGSLSGPWVTELERVWQTVRQSGMFAPVVELVGITFISEEGKALLARMWREGAALIAHGCCTRHIVGEITGTGPVGASGQCDPA
ncbi:MAG: hypothetical protein R3B11_16925 [Nitrospira sp.]|jgi:hypothetical protein|uniref:STAS domain-containing protein n=1 Tax=Nitrospira defluvii TaxID=330214 RepID=A0ABM8RGH9_9BACT|nr:hypothetical protein [Nitrospira defluvii]MBX3121185.1 hypothetical protein [Fimbriimonadaceae bacterium]MBX3649537.1 hypothetical protein [Rhodocyclaceae bacterium]MCS6325878.1 hypothetical protein [Nitrospira sp.]MCW5788050.1 hypothetical protein [Nitrospira sp.]MDR4477670.1 hypothetical protein [Nitrospira sp.]